MPLQLEDLAALDAPAAGAAGMPLMLAIDAIDEDAGQPRREFDAQALQELAQTIRERGVRQPVSVRSNPMQPDRWILNFGARRLRASKLAGLATIPAFIDASADSYDQVIENEQREGLRPLEIALFVQKRLALGESRSEIARRLGKSKQWMTLASALIDPPAWLLDAYRQGRCNGINELHELRRLHGLQPEAVEHWAQQQDMLTRDRIAQFKQGLDRDVQDPGPKERDGSAARLAECGTTTSPRAPRSPTHIQVEFEGQAYRLLLSSMPARPGEMYVVPVAGGGRRSVPARALTLCGFVNG